MEGQEVHDVDGTRSSVPRSQGPRSTPAVHLKKSSLVGRSEMSSCLNDTEEHQEERAASVACHEGRICEMMQNSTFCDTGLGTGEMNVKQLLHLNESDKKVRASLHRKSSP